ncbi:MAG: precorrin-3B C(17)-methyltransferase [Acidimicrobiales bacterium]
MTMPARILSCSVTAAGDQICRELGYEHVSGDLAETVRARWNDVDGFVLVIAVGAAVRIVGPLLGSKADDPAVVCVDDAGRHAVAVLGGHRRGANALAREVASLIGAEPVITAATDTLGAVALDELVGFTAAGDVAGVTAAMLAGARPVLENELGWPVPARLEAACQVGETGGLLRIVVTDEASGVAAEAAGVVVLAPASLVAGIGCSRGAPSEEVATALDAALALAGRSRAALACIATIDRRAAEPALVALGLPIRTFPPGALAEVAVPTPSPIVEAAVGTASVSEAAALLAAGPGSELVLTKQVSPHSTVALARRRQPIGRLALVGLGPGSARLRVPAAGAAVREADTVIGYEGYIELCADLLDCSKDVLGSPIGAEVERARIAVERATKGHSVAVVCSGDAGVYAMASLVIEEGGDSPGYEIKVVPGVTAALAAAACLGAPLGHDHVVISLSDLLTPWDAILRRVEAARDADLVIVLYNPRSKQRHWQLGTVRDLLSVTRAPSTPVGIVTDAGRPCEHVTVTTLGDLDEELVGMTTCVIIGSSATRVLGGRMVTPRGYRRGEPPAPQRVE